MLSHLQNSGAPRGQRCPGSGEAQSRERVKFIKILPVKTVYFSQQQKEKRMHLVQFWCIEDRNA
jgi:hypothetical protein